jgi:hypothetical protein
MTTETIPFISRPCPYCGTIWEVELPKAEADRWLAGVVAQDAFSRMTAPQREILITGTCPDCWPKEED